VCALALIAALPLLTAAKREAPVRERLAAATVSGPTPKSCATCQALLRVVAALIRKNQTEQLLEATATKICELAKIEGGEPEVCQGFIDELGWEVIYVYTQRYLIVDSKSSCALLGMCPAKIKPVTPQQRAAAYRALDDPGVRSPPTPPVDLSDPTVGTFVQFTDIHLDLQYEEDAPTGTAPMRPIRLAASATSTVTSHRLPSRSSSTPCGSCHQSRTSSCGPATIRHTTSGTRAAPATSPSRSS